MKNVLKNNKGMVLVVVYFVLVVLLGFSAVSFIRTINEARLTQRNNVSMQAFHEAESGISYAYFELAQQGFEWYTHDENIDPVAFPLTSIQPGTGTGQAYEENDMYRIGGRGFQVMTYPEQIDGEYTGVVVILSQATVNGITRAIEYRLGQASAYQFLLFSPTSHTFGSATYDGRNYGGIHVNGNIILRDWPKFHYLTKLTCSGPDGSGTGYFKQRVYYGNTDNYGIYPDWQGNVNYFTKPSDSTSLAYYMHTNSTAHFDPYISNRYTEFKSGDFTTGDISTSNLAYYLEAADAQWSYDKYTGTPGSAPSRHYTVGKEDLHNLAQYEMAGHRSSTDYKNLLDDGIANINVASWSGTEKGVFEEMYDNPAATSALWDKFWEQWKGNHANDAIYADGRNWERRFFQSAYDWGGGLGTPSNINREWWEDMEYGTDRQDGDDTALAQVEDAQGNPITDRYFLNTAEQIEAWNDWVRTQNLDEEGENQTLVQDKNQGDSWLDPGRIIDERDYGSDNQLKQAALDGGIYMGTQLTAEWLAWLEQMRAALAEFGWTPEFWAWLAENPFLGQRFEWVNPIVDSFTAETQFYNAQHPAGFYFPGAPSDKYEISNFMVIDVQELKETIEKPVAEGGMGGNFNGVVYVDLDNYQWSNGNNDSNATGVMLVNGEILPCGGLSIISPHNVLIKGNYNLDPEGNSDKNRDADDSEVIEWVIENKDYIGFESDLAWQPAEIISRRAVYTLSEDFVGPSYMPMAFDHHQQFYEEDDNVVGQDFVSGDAHYPTNSWVPSVSATRSAKSRVDEWFEHYPGATPPPDGKWSRAWVDTNWPEDTIFSLDNETFILGKDLRGDVWQDIEVAYDNKFSYAAIHGLDGSLNLDTPSKYQSVSAEKHIYNTAIVTPYSTSPYVLEYWGSKDRVINGAFIQLPEEKGTPWGQKTYMSRIPRSAEYARSDAPDSFFNYETRFGRGSIISERPAAGLTFGGGADSSWREIDSMPGPTPTPITRTPVPPTPPPEPTPIPPPPPPGPHHPQGPPHHQGPPHQPHP